MADKPPETARVEVKSAWLSKINWTQAVALVATVATLLSAGKYDIPPEQQASIVVAIQAVQSVATWVLKTWFTPSVTPASISSVKE